MSEKTRRTVMYDADVSTTGAKGHLVRTPPALLSFEKDCVF